MATEKRPIQETGEPGVVRIRLWPAMILVAIQLFSMFGVKVFTTNAFAIFISLFIGPMLVSVLLILWWFLFSRVPWRQRFVGLLLVTVVASVSYVLLDGSMRPMFFMYVVPFATTMTVLAWLIFFAWPWESRRWMGLVGAACAFLIWSTARLDGVSGDFSPELSYRWNETNEERFLAEIAAREASLNSGAVTASNTITLQPGDWPGFRGGIRNGSFDDSSIDLNWSEHGPRELWRQRIGPGWSSISVVGNWLFTQEQRGEDEAVVCYRAVDGAEVWRHLDKARFTETVSGAGPRGTPTFAEGRVYTVGANGMVDALDATTGKLIWQSDIVKDTGAKVPMWGYSCSPLVDQQHVIVYAGAGDNGCLVSYDVDSGELGWQAGKGGGSYSSPQLLTLCDIPQVLIASELGLESIDPDNGELLWTHEWDVPGTNRIVQPAQIDAKTLIFGTGTGKGSRRIDVSHDDDQWTTETVWETRDLKPYFNDFVIYKDHIFGFDGNIFCCVDVADGKRKWKKGRYGGGQVLLLKEQGKLLVLSEKGEVVLLDADPESHREQHRFAAVDGKTWNHPVVAHGKLFIRNGVEIACFDVSLDAAQDVKPDGESNVIEESGADQNGDKASDDRSSEDTSRQSSPR